MQKYFEKIIGMLKAKKDLVPVNRLLDDIINDKPKELGQLMAYADAIEIVNQVAEEFATDTNAGHTKLLDSLHEKILKSTFAEEVTEAEIEALVKAKNLTNNNQSLTNNEWIPVSSGKLPEEKENPVTRDWYVYPVMVRFEEITDIRYYSFGNGHWHHGPGIMDKYVTHWMDIKPYQPKGEK